MSVLSRLFGRKPNSEQPVDILPSADRADIHRGFDVGANSDIITGYQFCATIQLRTPLRVLQRHGEIWNRIQPEPPQIATEMWEGIWVPITRTFRDLGFDIDEPNFKMASEVGPIPQDGGEFLKFLLAVRKAAESDGTIEDRRAMVERVAKDSCWSSWVQALGGTDTILTRLFPPFILTVPRMNTKKAWTLIHAGYASPSEVLGASDIDLRSVSGIGPATITALRFAASKAVEPNACFVDQVIR